VFAVAAVKRGSIKQPRFGLLLASKKNVQPRRLKSTRWVLTPERGREYALEAENGTLVAQ